MHLRLTLFAGLIFVLTSLPSLSQPTGGRSGLSFLQLPAQARLSALGTRAISLPGNDAALFMQNPAALDTTKSGSLSLSMMPHLADTRLLTLAYAQSIGSTAGVWAGGIHYFNYGTFTETDASGNEIGQFRAADYAVSMGYGHTIQHITVGASAKFIGSGVASYQLWGLALDWGALFKHPRQDFTAGFVVKNMGFLRQNYGGSEPPPLPFDVRIGLTFKPQYMPVRISLTAHHLNAFDIVYNDPDLFFEFDANGNQIPRKVALPEQLLRHLSLGTELMLHAQFRLMLGYDHLLRQELRLQNRSGFEGISTGAWLRIKQLEISYGRTQFNAGRASHTLSAQLRLKN
ncbi:type IX secretion system protein PorQ [Arundinibacter roseus]|uniref:Type IX secretion system protein PorQ n=1 Tax=Arundinibacter roseus TaxID=2070510 RepID=A0A4R4KC01_9BACT|nr:type IX secretion system protein PorQ [Arundinibacter roseus]TDB65358.1 type IX secretion system protein PorQ [Arundinibacter roseus]